MSLSDRESGEPRGSRPEAADSARIAREVAWIRDLVDEWGYESFPASDPPQAVRDPAPDREQ